MTRIAVAGAAGRMGKKILTLALADKSFEVTGALEQPGHALLRADLGEVLGTRRVGVSITSDPGEALHRAQVLIDFSHVSVAEKHLGDARGAGAGLVIGTTGLSAAFLKKLKTASRRMAIVQSPNMSVGVNLLFKLSELAGRVLDEGYDLEISEIHHRMKKDAPSGTALKLLEILAGARGRNADKNTVYGRKGEVGVRPRGEIGVLAIRGGDVIGEHTVLFLGDGERIELTHRASSRDAFAQGALRAAKFIANKKTGLYDMSEVLALA